MIPILVTRHHNECLLWLSVGVSTWTHPLEDHFRSLVTEMKQDKSKSKKAKPKPPKQSLPPMGSNNPFRDANTGKTDQRHILDEEDGASSSDDDSSSLGTTNRSMGTTLGRSSGPQQPFIRSFGQSSELGESLKAVREGRIRPPPPRPHK